VGKVSVVINTLNEEKNLPRALASVAALADEIVVVDMHSHDKTVEIAKKAKARVFLHKKTNYVEPARNYAISKASGDWILVLDADEEITGNLVKKLKDIVKTSKADYYRLPRKNIIFSKWIKHARWWPDYNIRFFKKGKVTWNELIHSVPLTVGRGVDLQAKESNAIVHYHYSSISQYLLRLDRYTSEHAKLLVKDGYKFDWKDLIRKPVGEFVSRYFFAQGYKDGIHGLVLSGLQTFSEFSLYLKVWEMDSFKEADPKLLAVTKELNKGKKELNYWQADALIKEGKGVGQRVKRKFKLP